MTGYVHTNGMPKYLAAQGIEPEDVERMRRSGMSWPDMAERLNYRRRDTYCLFEAVKWHFRKHGREWPIRRDR